VFDEGWVVGGILGSKAHLAIGKGDIHTPVNGVLHHPMPADGLIRLLGIGGQTADVKRCGCGFAFDRPLRFDYCKTAQIRPTLGPVQARHLVEDKTTPDFQATVHPFRAFRRLGAACRVFVNIVVIGGSGHGVAGIAPPSGTHTGIDRRNRPSLTPKTKEGLGIPLEPGRS